VRLSGVRLQQTTLIVRGVDRIDADDVSHDAAAVRHRKNTRNDKKQLTSVESILIQFAEKIRHR
jgi:ribosomal protein L6P/L9E